MRSTLNLNGRLNRLEKIINTKEAQQDQANAADAAIVCREAIAAIDAGHIYDWTGKDATRYLSPTCNHEYFRLEHQAEQLIKWWAQRGHWKSPSVSTGWKAYRANSAVEMRAVLSEILGLLKMFDPYSTKEIEDMIAGRRPFPEA